MEVSFKTLKSCSSRVTLPMELILSSILPKLPVKSVQRFKCVSKSFLAEITSPEFNALFTEANHRLLIIPGDDETLDIYELDSLHSPPMLCPYPVPSKQFESRPMKVEACCESYLLIGRRFTDVDVLILFNPTTRIYRVLPKVYGDIYADYRHYGMCHCLDDDFNDDFKIVRLIQTYRRSKPIIKREVFVCSLSTNLWKSIELTKTMEQLRGYPVLVQNHLLVMTFYDASRDSHLTRIGCFDMKAERWSNDVLLPDILLSEIESNSTQQYHRDVYQLGVLEGQLRFSCYNVNKSSYSIWVMKEYGVKESWVKLMSAPGKDLEDVRRPIAYRQGSSDELLCIPNYSGQYKWYNLRDKRFTEMVYDIYAQHSYAWICKGSLLNFPGGQPIRSSSKKQVDVYDDDDSDDSDDDDSDDSDDNNYYDAGEEKEYY
ncbi:F-box protein CPR1-like [Silene latifolia]|uniref:F-box protein CPR1-like n=1 Tax=Silene latifolia TaxID=37657 RepID=UPI003D76C24B